MVDTVGKPLLNIMEKATVKNPAPAPAALPVAEPKAVFPKAEVTAPVVEDEDMDDVKTIKKHPYYGYFAPQVVNAARLKEPVAKWAEKILGLVPEQYDAMLLDVVNRDDLVEYLGQFEPAILKEAALADWFKALAEAILAQYDKGAEEEPLPDNGAIPKEGYQPKVVK